MQTHLTGITSASTCRSRRRCPACSGLRPAGSPPPSTAGMPPITGHFAEAVQQFTEALKRDPSLAPAYNGRGLAYLRLKEYIPAIADFDDAIRLDAAYEIGRAA